MLLLFNCYLQCPATIHNHGGYPSSVRVCRRPLRVVALPSNHHAIHSGHYVQSSLHQPKHVLAMGRGSGVQLLFHGVLRVVRVLLLVQMLLMRLMIERLQ
jgi:hypothetical protein